MGPNLHLLQSISYFRSKMLVLCSLLNSSMTSPPPMIQILDLSLKMKLLIDLVLKALLSPTNECSLILGNTVKKNVFDPNRDKCRVF